MNTEKKQPQEVPAAAPFYGLSQFSSKPSPDAGEHHSNVSLRQKAEAQFREREEMSQEKIAALSHEERGTILHELRVHQIELEMQNEELRAAQAELDASRARYFDLYDLAPVGYFTVSEAGLILEANLTAATLFGVERRALVKLPISRLILKEDQNIYYKHRQQLLETGEAQHCELRMVKSDGTTAWTHMQSTTAQDEAGSPTCRVVTSDISGRKQAEDALRETNEYLGNLFNYANVPIVVWDAQSRIKNVNRAFESLVGKKAAEIRGGPLEALFPTASVAGSMESIRRTLKGERWEAIEIDILHLDGSVRTVLWNSATVYAADGKTPVAAIAQGQDITGRKQAEEKLQNLQTAVEQSANTIIITDPLGNIEYVNPAFEKTTGYLAAEAIGQNPRILKSGAQDEGFYRDLWATITSGKIWRGQFLNRHRDGSFYWEEATISPVNNRSGETVNFIAIKEEITARKAMEASLDEALVQARAADRAKSEFLGIMSHELRTPLNGVLGFAQLLSDTTLDEEQKSLVETVSKCGEHLLAIVQDILDFSSIEKGTLAIHVAPLTVAALVKESEDTVRINAAEKGIEVHCELAAGVPEQIIGDEQRMRQVLINLLGNAVKFTTSGSVVLRVAPDAEGRFLDFCVVDTGIGISSETISHLFQPFVQADSTMNRPFGGTGLGLAISKRLAEAMGGAITVASTPEKGSTFTFRFPLESAPLHAGGMAAVPAHISDRERTKSARTEPPVQTGGTPGALVLVVEDDPDNRTLAGKILQSLGYRAEFAANGVEAVEAVVPGKFAAILMDVVMPAMNGLDATRKIREFESGSRVPIIALSANVMPGSREICLAAGMDDFLSKPIKRAELAAVLACVARRSCPQ